MCDYKIYENVIDDSCLKNNIFCFCVFSIEDNNKSIEFYNDETEKKILHELNGINIKQELSNNFCCDKCSKIYQTQSGLWKHTKKCIVTTVTDSNADSFDKDQLILMLIKQNADLIKETSGFKTAMMENQNIMMENQNTMLKVIENGTHNTTNSHNKSFNLQFFLNEECKDAMNMSEFINSIEIKVSDLVNIGKLGYVERVSNIIMKQLNDTDMNKRPVHCSDAKRETLYVKEENKWEKEGPDNKKMKKAVRGVEKKNFLMWMLMKNMKNPCE